jgi:hypothetical protein
MIKTIETDSQGVHVTIQRRDAGGNRVEDFEDYSFEEIHELATAAANYLWSVMPPVSLGAQLSQESPPSLTTAPAPAEADDVPTVEVSDTKFLAEQLDAVSAEAVKPPPAVNPEPQAVKPPPTEAARALVGDYPHDEKPAGS